MAILHIEKLGGLANYGGSRARIRSRGQLDTADLSKGDQQAIESLFRGVIESEAPGAADGFRFRISRTTSAGTETIEAPEASLPAILASCVKDEFI